MSTTKLGNPAVVGLAGFGLTTLLLQFHNLGLIGLGPVVAMGFIFGGLAQMIAGFLEQKMGNNFGFAAFVSYGSFWIGLGIIWMLNNSGIYVSSHTDVGFYLIGWTLLTLIFWVGSLFIHSAMAFTFTTLVIGFVLLDLAHFGFPQMTTLAGPWGVSALFTTTNVLLVGWHGVKTNRPMMVIALFTNPASN